MSEVNITPKEYINSLKDMLSGLEERKKLLVEANMSYNIDKTENMMARVSNEIDRIKKKVKNDEDITFTIKVIRSTY